VLRVMIAIDTSGRTCGYWDQFMVEVESLMGDFDRVEVTLVECDAAISRVRQLQREDVDRVINEGILGGGGTDLRPPFELAALNPPSCLVYLTDGDGPVPAVAPGFPVLWVLTDEASDPPPWGEVVRMKLDSSGDEFASWTRRLIL
jgi:predicted metal-dependent peptidase